MRIVKPSALFYFPKREVGKVQVERTRTAVEAVKFLWDYLGWTGSSRPVALGLFGRLDEEPERGRGGRAWGE